MLEAIKPRRASLAANEQAYFPMTLKEFSEFVSHADWTFAKTMPHIPHEYTLKKNSPREVFDAAVVFIREQGEVRPWGKYVHTYLDHDGWTYWTMGAPVPATILINRERTRKLASLT